jgi:uncharacterized protein
MVVRTVILALAAALAPLGATHAQPAAPAGPAPVAAPAPLYLLVYQKGPAWIEGKPIHEQKLRDHLTYMQGLLAEGRLVAGGPFGNINGGMAILRVASIAEAEAVLAKDPALLNGTFTGSVMEWTPFLDSQQTLVRR